MKYLNYLVIWGITSLTYYFGLEVFGYDHIIKLGIHLTIIGTIVYLLKGIYNRILFNLNFDKSVLTIAQEYFRHGLPQPKKYGYTLKNEKSEKWYGQTYLEEIEKDASVSDVNRLRVQFYLKDIYTAEKQNPFLETKLLKITLKAMYKYDEMLSQHGKNIELDT